MLILRIILCLLNLVEFFLLFPLEKYVIIWFLSIDVSLYLVYPHNASLNQENAATSLHFTPVDWGD